MHPGWKLTSIVRAYTTGKHFPKERCLHGCYALIVSIATYIMYRSPCLSGHSQKRPPSLIRSYIFFATTLNLFTSPLTKGHLSNVVTHRVALFERDYCTFGKCHSMTNVQKSVMHTLSCKTAQLKMCKRIV